MLSELRFTIVTYLHSRWEGTANDHRVYREALDVDFHILQGRFFLGDAGHLPTAGTLTPYRGVRYHLKEWGRSNQKLVVEHC